MPRKNSKIMYHQEREVMQVQRTAMRVTIPVQVQAHGPILSATTTINKDILFSELDETKVRDKPRYVINLTTKELEKQGTDTNSSTCGSADDLPKVEEQGAVNDLGCDGDTQITEVENKPQCLDDRHQPYENKLQPNEVKYQHADKISEPESIVFDSLELLSLYTVMMVKRFMKSANFRQEYLSKFIKTIESNLARLKIEKKWYFATIRDHVRLCHDEWHSCEDDVNVGHMNYNTHLLIVVLLLGIEKLWVSDGCLPLYEEFLIKELRSMAEPGKPSFALKQLCQSDPMFDFWIQHSPNLETLFMPLSDNLSFQNCVKYTNLRVIELAGGVSDKVICSALWNISNKKSEKVLEMAVKDSKESGNWHLSLPHLEVLRNNMLQTKALNSVMRLSLGAVALAVQPKLQAVETLQSWNTYDAMLFLLDMEAKQRSKNVGSDRTFAVTSLTVHYGDRLDMKELKRVMKACPKLNSLCIYHAENIHKDLSLLCAIIPMKQVTKLNLDASCLTNRELTVLLAEMYNLEHLTLQLTLQAIINFNIPLEKDARMVMLPNIDTLVIEFIPLNMTPEELVNHPEFESTDMLSLLSCFAVVKNLYFCNTLIAPSPYLVYGCIGGALAVLHRLRHLSVMSCHEDIPREFALQCQNEKISKHGHFHWVPHMLADLQEETTFKHLRALESFIIDEFYITPAIDQMIESLRLCGVLVAIHYRHGEQTYPQRIKGMSSDIISSQLPF